jgi:uncharacterized protein (TIGR00255 family)
VPKSMTAFSRCVAQGPSGDLTWELRSVNHRFREVAMRLPEELRFHEGAFRDAITASAAAVLTAGFAILLPRAHMMRRRWIQI